MAIRRYSVPWHLIARQPDFLPVQVASPVRMSHLFNKTTNHFFSFHQNKKSTYST